jgi:hypothetical protein
MNVHKVLYCGKCNKETPHYRLTQAQVKNQISTHNGWFYRVLSFISVIVFYAHASPKKISYFRCSICHSDYDNNESMPSGWS